VSQYGAGALTASPGKTPGKRNNRRELTLAAVVERARNRWGVLGYEV
jgi:hypothetical protein